MEEKEGLLIRVSIFARLIGTSAGTVYRWVDDGSIRGVRIGPSVFVYRSELARLQAGDAA